MSTAFTTLTTGENALSLSMANEIVLAYSERRQVLGQSVVSALTAGTSAQDKTLWLAMQVWCEANCTSFIDHVSGPLNPDGTNFLYFTLATWRAVAGLNASGYRRSTDGTTMLYGNIQAGDVWGKWTFEDLQKGFGALKWIKPILSWVDGNSASVYLTPDPALTWEEVKAIAEAAWSCGGTASAPCAYTEGDKYYSGGTPLYWLVWAGSGSGKPRCTTIVVPHIACLYIRGKVYKRWPGATYDPVYDDNGSGITESASYYLKETSAEEIETTWTGALIGTSCASFPTWCINPEDYWTLHTYPWRGYISDSGVVIKYNFTNA